MRVMLAFASALVLAASGAVPSEKKAETHSHPGLPFEFKAFEGWRQVPRPGDEGTFEAVSPNGEVRVLLWYTATEQDARRYLMKMADMKGLNIPRGAEPDSVSNPGHDALAYDVPGTFLAVIHNGRSDSRPGENALYIVQISCPPGRHEEYRELTRSIFDSVRISRKGGP